MAQDNSGFERTCACILTTLKIGKKSAKFENQAPNRHDAASLSGVGLSLSELHPVGLSVANGLDYIRAETRRGEQERVYKDLLYPRLYQPRRF